MSKAQYGSSFDDVDVLCPFYVKSSRKYKFIECEGVNIRTKTSLKFSRRSEHREYMEKYCNRHYKACEICKAAQKKYEEQGI